jgi:hypothetical protein
VNYLEQEPVITGSYSLLNIGRVITIISKNQQKREIEQERECADAHGDVAQRIHAVTQRVDHDKKRRRFPQKRRDRY